MSEKKPDKKIEHPPELTEDDERILDEFWEQERKRREREKQIENRDGKPKDE